MRLFAALSTLTSVLMAGGVAGNTPMPNPVPIPGTETPAGTLPASAATAGTFWEKTFFSDSNLKSDQNVTGQDRLELFVMYEYLDPNDDYGSWKQFNAAYYQKLPESLTLYYQLALFERSIENNAMFASIGAYKDWSPSYYTFTQIGGSPDNQYLPKIRFDHELYLKFGEEKNLVGILGMSFMEYYNGHRDRVASAGLTYYGPRYNITYRHFFNTSYPGNVTSRSDLLSIGYGEEKKQWIYLDLSYGNQAYRSILADGYTPFDEDSADIKLSYRKWTTKNSGWFGAIGFSRLNTNYNKYLFQVGYFQEF